MPLAGIPIQVTITIDIIPLPPLPLPPPLLPPPPIAVTNGIN